ncbi:MAG TPA: hypothetical protein VF739_12455 [Ktedonobacterales bacterium]
MAQSIAAYAPLALANAKRAIHAGFDLDFTAGLAQEIDCFVACVTSRDFDGGPQRLPGETSPGLRGQLKRQSPANLAQSRRDHLTGKPAVVYMK